MDEIYDIYDSNTFRLVKPDVKLTKKGTHKDLRPGRYVKHRIGRNIEPIDFDTMISELMMLRKRVSALESIISP